MAGKIDEPAFAAVGALVSAGIWGTYRRLAMGHAY